MISVKLLLTLLNLHPWHHLSNRWSREPTPPNPHRTEMAELNCLFPYRWWKRPRRCRGEYNASCVICVDAQVLMGIFRYKKRSNNVLRSTFHVSRSTYIINVERPAFRCSRMFTFTTVFLLIFCKLKLPYQSVIKCEIKNIAYHANYYLRDVLYNLYTCFVMNVRENQHFSQINSN